MWSWTFHGHRQSFFYTGNILIYRFENIWRIALIVNMNKLWMAGLWNNKYIRIGHKSFCEGTYLKREST
jgi:hypothetical protein